METRIHQKSVARSILSMLVETATFLPMLGMALGLQLGVFWLVERVLSLPGDSFVAVGLAKSILMTATAVSFAVVFLLMILNTTLDILHRPMKR